MSSVISECLDIKRWRSHDFFFTWVTKI